MPEKNETAARKPRASKAASADAAIDKAVRAFAIEAARSIHDDKCVDVVVLDVRGISQLSDYIVIGTGTSDRQMRAALTHVSTLGGERGMRELGTSLDERGTWLLADFADVVVHVFEPNTRAHYDLEMLWGDASRVRWERRAPRAKLAEPKTR